MSELDDIIKLVDQPSKDSFGDRIKFLKNIGMDTSIIEKGVFQAKDAINRDVKSFVIYGEPQSGKTEVMIVDPQGCQGTLIIYY